MKFGKAAVLPRRDPAGENRRVYALGGSSPSTSANMYTVYVIKSDVRSFHYIGHTSNVVTRLKVHNYGKVQSTKAYRPFQIIYTEKFTDKSSAFRREMYLKSAEGNIWLRNKLKQDEIW